MLARSYLSYINDLLYDSEAYGQGGGWGAKMFAHHRLGTIESFLGKKAFEQTVQPIHDRWERLFTTLRSSPHYTNEGLSCYDDESRCDCCRPTIPDQK